MSPPFRTIFQPALKTYPAFILEHLHNNPILLRMYEQCAEIKTLHVSRLKDLGFK